MRTRGASVVVALTAISLAAPVTSADGTIQRVCPLIVHQARMDRSDQVLAARLAAIRLGAAQSIFSLVDELWKNDAVERLVYLAAKHDRDVADIDLKRQQLLLERHEAELRQYEVLCTRSRELEQPVRAYLQADCRRVGKSLALAEVDLEYANELMASFKDLREEGVATQQAVIRTERDVALARQRAEHHGRLLQGCLESDNAAGNKIGEPPVSR